MAKKSINLLPKSYYETLEKEQKKGWISVWGFFAIFIIVILSSVFVVADIVISGVYTNKLDSAKSLYDKQISLSNVLNKAVSVTSRSNAITYIKKTVSDYDSQVKKIEQVQTKVQVSLRGFGSKDGKLEVTAIAKDLKDIAVFMNAIETTTTLKDPQLINLFPVNTDDTNLSSRSWQFTISVNS